MNNFFQIYHRRFGVQIPHDLVCPRIINKLSYSAFLVLQAAKDQGIRGAGLYTGRFNFPVPDHSFFIFCYVMGGLYPLDTEGTFFHNSFAAYGDIRVQLQIHRLGPFPFKPVESAHLVWAVLGTKAGSDAAVIYLIV